MLLMYSELKRKTYMDGPKLGMVGKDSKSQRGGRLASALQDDERDRW